MEFNSIIWLPESNRHTLDRQIIENLNLQGVYDRLLANDEILFSLCMDKETIHYRQVILEDFYQNKGLMQELSEALERFYDLKPLYNAKLYEQSNLYRIIDLVILMEKSIEALEELNQILRFYPLTSQGLLCLKEDVERNLETDTFKTMKKDLREIKYIFSQIKSAVLSVNMTSGLRPKFAQVTSVETHHHRYPKAFRHVSDTLSLNPEFLGQRIASYVPVFRIGRLNYKVLEEIEYALREHKPKMENFVKTYTRMDITPFIQLHDEVTFYESGHRLITQMESKGLPMCKPTFHEGDYNLHFIKGYNINLALRDQEETIITNNFDMDKSNQAYIITGANRGGKTTFTQCIGQIQLLGQLGLYVPAASAHMGLADNILSHFPVSEKENLDKGKFGKECEMFVALFKETNPRTLVLMNESFAGTSHLESLSIAAEAVKALLSKGIPFVYNTHLHELYDEVTHWIDEQTEEHLIHTPQYPKSLVTKMNNHQISYEMEVRKPLGRSYAMEIASRYGVTYSQLTGKEKEGDEKCV